MRTLAEQISNRDGQHGTVLETLVTYLFKTVSGLTVESRKYTEGGEVDVLVGNHGYPGQPLRWFGDYFLVECKDVDDTIEEKELGHFLTKLNFTKTKQGAIVSLKGLT